MAITKKTKVGIRSAIPAILIGMSIFLLFLSEYQTVEIIYFTNPQCAITNKTDDLIDELKEDFQNKISVRKINVNMYPGDQPDTEEIIQLREKYKVYGVPDIVINGEKFMGKFTNENIKEKICDNFIIKPEAC